MLNAGTIAKWALPIIGGAIILVFQTPPDIAKANAAKWFAEFTGYFPDPPNWVDPALTGAGLLLIATPFLLWIRRRWRTAAEKATFVRSMPTVEDIRDLFAQPLSSAPTTSRPEQSEWIPLHQALRYLVYQSKWADRQLSVHDDDEFDRLVASEVRERLARGEIAARGKFGIDRDALQRATEPIANEFWVNAFLQPHGEIVLADDERSVAATSGGGPAYRAVIVRKSDVESVWPERSSRDLTSLARYVDGARSKVRDELALQRTKQRQRRSDAGRGAGLPQSPIETIARAMDDDLMGQEERAQLQVGALLPPSKAAQIRNIPLAEALGWAVYGEWGKAYHVPAVGMFIGIGADPRKLLARFTQLAREGKLTIWGKRDHPGFFEKVPQTYWQDNELTIADVFGSVVVSGDDPYRDLMLNREQVQREWPHES